jgi:thymidylate synthase
MATTMRSQDLWTGLPYDIFATTLHELMAEWLGDYHHHVDSLTCTSATWTSGRHPLRDVVTTRRAPSLEAPREGFAALLADGRSGRRVHHPGWEAMAAVLASYQQCKSRHREVAERSVDDIGGPLAEGLRAWYAALTSR